MYNFNDAVVSWGCPPVAGQNINSKYMLFLEDKQFSENISILENAHFNMDQFIEIYDKLNINDVSGATILDYGCGFGMDSIKYTEKDNFPILMDINEFNLSVSVRNLKRYGTNFLFGICGEHGFNLGPLKIPDVFHANGVLHHTPYIKNILGQAWTYGVEECKLLLYADTAWEKATGEKCPDITFKIDEHRHFKKYVRFMDAVGDYADWYTPEKLERIIGKLWSIDKFDYLKSQPMYGCYILKRMVG